ncbi:MAG: carboxylating nicotinate-nucleotide diphosphorylase [Candidatus Methylopumilus sp.]|nr:carboxylating nicotinate-nucleotide diphosphorylase [Candidatus Methylopumilus sp.]
MNELISKQVLTQLAETIKANVNEAIIEDLSPSGSHAKDFTAKLIAPNQLALASIISREPAVICGIPWVEESFKQIAPSAAINWQVKEGESVKANQTLCTLKGKAHEMLSAERCALNFLQTLSATATATKQFVEAISGTKARILDTRKTIPGLRIAQKYAVTVGGGLNHRIGLYDGILIKENHIAAAGSIETVLAEANKIAAQQGNNLSIQIEVENLVELECALNAGAQLILLDNFDTVLLKEAVALNANRAILEASGGITLSNVREMALTGVDRISIGSLTKNIQAIDLSMRFTKI